MDAPRRSPDATMLHSSCVPPRDMDRARQRGYRRDARRGRVWRYRQRHARQYCTPPPVAPAEPVPAGTGQHQAARRTTAGRRANRIVRALRAGVARQRHYHGPLGDGGHPPGEAFSALSARIPARDHGRIRAPYRATHAGQQGRLGNRNHRRAWRGAYAHGVAYRLHVGG